MPQVPSVSPEKAGSGGVFPTNFGLVATVFWGISKNLMREVYGLADTVGK